MDGGRGCPPFGSEGLHSACGARLSINRKPSGASDLGKLTSGRGAGRMLLDRGTVPRRQPADNYDTLRQSPGLTSSKARSTASVTSITELPGCGRSLAEGGCLVHLAEQGIIVRVAPPSWGGPRPEER